MLNEHQKLGRFEVCSRLCDPFLDQIVTCHKKWIFNDNFKRSNQFLDRDETSKQLPKAKFALAKDYGDSLMVCNWCYPLHLFGNKSEQYCNQLADMHASLQKKLPW